MRGFSLRQHVRAVRLAVGALAILLFLASGTALSGLSTHDCRQDPAAAGGPTGLAMQIEPGHAAHLPHSACCGLLCTSAVLPDGLALAGPTGEPPPPDRAHDRQGIDPDGIRRPPKSA